MMDANGEVGKRFRTSINWLLAWVTSYPVQQRFSEHDADAGASGDPGRKHSGGVGKATAYLAVQLKKTPEALPSLPQRCRMLPERSQKT